MRKIAHQKPIGTLISLTNPWSQHYPEQIYQQNCPQRGLRKLTLLSITIIILPYHYRHHNHHQHPLIIVIIITNSGSCSTSRSIIISTIFIIASTSSPLSLSSSSSSSSSSLQNHLYHHHRRRRHLITTVWNKNMLKKRRSICQIRWDTIVIFIPQSTKTLQLKKGLNFNMQKNYFKVETTVLCKKNANEIRCFSFFVLAKIRRNFVKALANFCRVKRNFAVILNTFRIH